MGHNGTVPEAIALVFPHAPQTRPNIDAHFLSRRLDSFCSYCAKGCRLEAGLEFVRDKPGALGINMPIARGFLTMSEKALGIIRCRLSLARVIAT
jgi:hypothetical protein